LIRLQDHPLHRQNKGEWSHHQRLHALDATTGLNAPRPVVIERTAPAPVMAA
jgi:hypothetical protein